MVFVVGVMYVEKLMYINLMMAFGYSHEYFYVRSALLQSGGSWTFGNNR
jgi:hypothetical protein